MRQAEQLTLDLGYSPSFAAEDFLVSDCNRTAHTAVTNWPHWPDRTLLLTGPPGCGKGHLASIWSAQAGASRRWTFSPENGTPAPDCAILLEDCDRNRPGEADFFHLLNLVREQRGWLLMTARLPPDRWGVYLPDLRSRLRLAPTVAIDQPDEALVQAMLVKLFSDRQIIVEAGVIAYVAKHCERSFEAVADFVRSADRLALAAGRRVNRTLAAALLSEPSEEG